MYALYYLLPCTADLSFDLLIGHKQAARGYRLSFYVIFYQYPNFFTFQKRHGIITPMVDKKDAEPMIPAPKPEEPKPEVEGYMDIKLAIHKSAIKLCNSVEFRGLTKVKDGYILDIMLKGLSKEFNQFQGSRKFVQGLKITGAEDPEIYDKIVSLAHFG